MPIAGAPRTTMARIASATSAAVRHSTSTTSPGRRRWSRRTTRSSSSRRICSGSSKGHRRVRRVRLLEVRLRGGQQAKRLEDRHALDRAGGGAALAEAHGERAAALCERGDGDAAVLAAERAEHGDERVAREVGAAKRRRAALSGPGGPRRRRRPVERDVARQLVEGTAGVPAGDELPRGRRERGRGRGKEKQTECDERCSAQVPSSHEARYFACSSLSWSTETPIVSSFRRAISSSISTGTG